VILGMLPRESVMHGFMIVIVGQSRSRDAYR
jgi:hypothetical protein